MPQPIHSTQRIVSGLGLWIKSMRSIADLVLWGINKLIEIVALLCTDFFRKHNNHEKYKTTGALGVVA